MKSASEAFERIEQPDKCRGLLEVLSQVGHAQLVRWDQPGRPIPVRRLTLLDDRRLLLELDAPPQAAGLLGDLAGAFVLDGRTADTALQSAPLHALQSLAEEEGVRLVCRWPRWLDVIHRRREARAELDALMDVRVEARPGAQDSPVRGRLLNLSMGGCLVDYPDPLPEPMQPGRLFESFELQFPNGLCLLLKARLQHVQSPADGRILRCGHAFEAVDAVQADRLAFCVREIERERTRDSRQAPSPLLVRAEPVRLANAESERRHGLDYLTPMARRLAQVAAWLAAQSQRLESGESVDAASLERHSAVLLDLLEEDREALLFACHCLVDDAPPIQHGIAVAVRLADLMSEAALPPDSLRAIVACALVHDLGKVLLPASLREAERLTAEQRQAFADHVRLLRERLDGCEWLPAPIVAEVVEGIHRRLDDGGESLGELARAAAVVDVVDAMSRARADRAGYPVSGIYRSLIGDQGQLDRRWCQRYVRRFGVVPIGSLVRFADGALGWVQRLDREGAVAQVQLTDRKCLKGAVLGVPVIGRELTLLGRIASILVPETE